MNLDYYWLIAPNQFKKHVNIFKQKEQNRSEEWNLMNHILGQYIAFAVNDPKKYPKKPFEIKKELSKQKEMTSNEMERVAKRNTLILGGTIKHGNEGRRTTSTDIS